MTARNGDPASKVLRAYEDPTKGGAPVDMSKAWWKVDGK